MTSNGGQLDDGLRAYDRGAWLPAYRRLSAAWREDGLEPSALWRLSLAAYLVGEEADCLRALEEAHHGHLDRGETAEAVKCAVWLGMHLVSRGDTAKATGWFGRAARLVAEVAEDRVERGYALLPTGHRHLALGENEQAVRAAAQAAAIGQGFGDRDLLTLGLHLQGRALLRLGRVEEGLALLDEAMVAVTADRLSPMVTGIVYCSVIGACREVLALARAQQWTAALTDWCASQPDMLAYKGECLVYRAEILLRRGRWAEAADEARHAADRLERTPGAVAPGAAHYLRAEAHRLSGDFEAAEASYRAASRAGTEPQPGLALLRLAQGDTSAARAAIRRVLAETPQRLKRARLLPAQIEILLAAGDVDGARRACAELEDIAPACARGVVDTLVAHARGAVALAAGDTEASLAPLRGAWHEWREVDAPYEAARVRILIGRACRSLGDAEGAALELEAAREALERLGAAPDLAALEAYRSPSPADTAARTERADHGLTARELDVITLVATGRTNRAIAEELSISSKTVARHLSNIYAKLGLSSRSAATAYAYEHGLVDPST